MDAASCEEHRLFLRASSSQVPPRRLDAADPAQKWCRGLRVGGAVAGVVLLLDCG